MRRTTLLLAGLLVILIAIPAHGATITIINKDAAGQGLNDPTPATPVGGNPGTTIGQQRMNVFLKAAEFWSGILPGNVDIRVYASFSDLTCSTSTAVLGGTSPNYVESDFAGGIVPGVWYVVAEASQLAGYDLEPGNPYMTATFNSKLGQAGCLDGNYFYYGFDANTPVTDVNLLTTTLHEFAHGLGFISLADESTGKFCCDTQPRPDIFDAFTYDTTTKKSWNDMATDAERQASAINTGNLVWTGPAANAAGAAYLSKIPALMVSSPPAAAGTYTVGTAIFGAPLTAGNVTGTMVVALDPSDPTGPLTTDACSPLTNAAAVGGKIALVDRGTCAFVLKAKNVQTAGGIGIVVMNNVDGSPPNMAGTDPTITIPIVSISLGDGAKLRANLPATATIGLDPSHSAGMNAAGQMLLFAPSPVQPGSSVSHWDTSCVPNLLMEPNINNDLPIGVDITPDVLRDVGWWGTSPAGPTYYYVASVAHSAGGTPAAPAFFTSDFFVANEGTSDASVTFKFLGHDGDGTSGAEQSATIAAGKAVTYHDVLSSLFGLTGNNYGAVRIAANTASLKISSVTTTPTPDGTGAFGQSVPAVMSVQLITPGSPGAISGVREDATGRTNLVLLNATNQPLDVLISLWDDNGASLGTPLTKNLLPLEMTQLGRVIQTITGARNTANATIVLSTATSGGAFTAFASLLDNLGTNDPATLFASTGFGGSGAASFLVSSVARAAGGTPAAPAMYTTDFFVANVGSAAANVTLQYLAFGSSDGSTGPTRNYTLNPQTAYTFRDVLGTVFGISTTADKGAILVTSSSPGLAIDSVTTTPAPSGPGRFGQSVPGIPSPSWIRVGTKAAIVGVREDGTGRTNLVLVNGPPDGGITPYTIAVNYALFADNGTQLGTTQQATLAPLGMTQINRVVTNGVGAPTGSAGTLVLWTSTPGAVFTGFASLVNNGTNDPATLLPQ